MTRGELRRFFCSLFSRPARPMCHHNPLSPEAFSRDLNASHDRTWSAVTYVAGASFFKIKAFERVRGLMTLDFELKDVFPYVDCGGAANSTMHTTVPALQAIGLAVVTLEGTANITIRSESRNRTAIQFNSRYNLKGIRLVPTALQSSLPNGTSTPERRMLAVVNGARIGRQPSYQIDETS